MFKVYAMSQYWGFFIFHFPFPSGGYGAAATGAVGADGVNGHMLEGGILSNAQRAVTLFSGVCVTWMMCFRCSKEEGRDTFSFVRLCFRVRWCV